MQVLAAPTPTATWKNSAAAAPTTKTAQPVFSSSTGYESTDNVIQMCVDITLGAATAEDVLLTGDYVEFVTDVSSKAIRLEFTKPATTGDLTLAVVTPTGGDSNTPTGAAPGSVIVTAPTASTGATLPRAATAFTVCAQLPTYAAGAALFVGAAGTPGFTTKISTGSGTNTLAAAKTTLAVGQTPTFCII